ncbi:DUF6263 family protein [uncultured Formosa sp.]|uniref:DUF6263 family protein n=1 Tax=uncultured Formosa sp. TaxID=255435 RepID=UPI00262D68E4|nr:DUF6263 family protein [uncultured Formosa sp.]
MKTFYTLILISFFLTSCQTEQTDLALKLEKGKTYKQISNAKATITQKANGQEIKMIMTINGTLSFLVNTVNDTDYSMEATFDELNMSMQTPQGTMSFSSEKEDKNDIMSSVFKTMKNKTFGITMSKTGKIVDIKAVNNAWDTAINSMEQLSDRQKGQLKAQIMKSYGAQVLKDNIEMATAIYPEHGLSTGDTWTINKTIESNMHAKMITDYKFVERTPDHILITGKSAISTTDKEAYIEFNGVSMKYDLTGTMTSKIKVDNNTGWIIEANMDQEIKGDAFIKENDRMPNGMTIPMYLTNITTITN